MRRRLLVLFAGLVALAGCAQVPTSGPIVGVEQPLTGVGTESFVRALARPPVPGMTTLEIVQGFLDAASGFEDDHAVARQYLTPEMARQWDPEARIRVLGDDSSQLADVGTANVRLRAAQVGSVTSDRQYVPLPPDTPLREDFGLEQVDGQWRIGRLAPGLLLSRAAVERSYRAFRTYFVARPGGILTPNSVLLNSSVRDVPAELIDSLLQGPSRWLAPTVLNAFPPGTTLQAFAITDGVARIDLSSAALQASDLARQQMSAQMVWTLRQIAGVKAMVLTVDGQPFTVPGADAVQPRTAWAEYSPDGLKDDANWYFQRDGAVYAVGLDGATGRVAGVAGRAQPPITDPLIGLDLKAVAGTDGFGRSVTSTIQSGSQWRIARTSARTGGGSWDRTGLLWLPDADAGAQTVTVLGSSQVPVARTPVTSIQISRDGTRALVVAGPAGAGVAYLMRVNREGTLRLTRPRIIVSDPVRAAVWQSADAVALLVKPAGQPAQVSIVDLGLFSQRPLGGPPRARTVAAAPERQLLSGTADGRVWGFNGAIWVPQVTGSQPRYPG